MNILSWILFGLVVGIIANSINDSTQRKGEFLGSILLSIVGALIGGFVANIFLGLRITGFNIVAFFIAVVCSLLLLFFGKTVRKI
jgi:uncharacterized membrane protein YeaQ/YmgE (transglycosylase-associated protein family)